MTRIVILSTKENFVWTSMQEIIPMIEKLWMEAASEYALCKLINVDQVSPRQNARELLKADLIIVTAFNVSILNHLTFLRRGMGLKSPWIFYLHGLATIGLWPPLFLGGNDLFSQQDFFIGTCPGDKKCLDLIFDRANYYEIPFHLLEEYKQSEVQIPQSSYNFHYMGRISPQKNLHQMIDVFEQFHQKYPDSTLHLYGKEDHLGHPNMGMECRDYQDQLNEQIKSLKAKDQIIFHGFISREKIQYLLDELDRDKNFFITLTTHSDENFGMAVYRALVAGWKVVMSDWGGHKNFIREIPEQSFAVSVVIEGDRPQVNLSEALMQMESIIKCKSIGSGKRGDKSYFEWKTLLKHARSCIGESLEKSKSESIPLMPEKMVKDLLVRKKSWSLGQQKIFESYLDPAAIKFLNSYKDDY